MTNLKQISLLLLLRKSQFL